MAEVVRMRSAAGPPGPGDLASLLDDLTATFGPSLLSFMLDADMLTIRRWAKGAEAPPGLEKRAREIDAAFVLLRAQEAPETIRAWFMGMNPHLHEISPAEALRAGSARAVMAAARAHLT